MRPVRLPLILNFRPTKNIWRPQISVPQSSYFLPQYACPIYFGRILPQSSYFLPLFGRILPQSSYFLPLSFLSSLFLTQSVSISFLFLFPYIKHVMDLICQPVTFQLITLYFRSLSFHGPSFFVSQ